MRLTKKEKRKIMKVANFTINLQIVTMILGVIGIGITMFAKLFDWQIFQYSFPGTCIVWMIYCLSKIFLEPYVDMAIDIEEGYFK